MYSFTILVCYYAKICTQRYIGTYIKASILYLQYQYMLWSIMHSNASIQHSIGPSLTHTQTELSPYFNVRHMALLCVCLGLWKSTLSTKSIWLLVYITATHSFSRKVATYRLSSLLSRWEISGHQSHPVMLDCSVDIIVWGPVATSLPCSLTRSFNWVHCASWRL